MRHPHADLIKEWIEDTSRVVQWRNPEIISSNWMDWEAPSGIYPTFNPDMEWRFKPEPKPDVVRYAEVNKYRCCDQFWDLKTAGDNLKLTFDGETGELKNAEVLKNG